MATMKAIRVSAFGGPEVLKVRQCRIHSRSNSIFLSVQCFKSTCVGLQLVQNNNADPLFQVEEIPKPAPGPGEVLVRIHAAGVNPVEAYIRAGTYAKLPSLPYTPGAEGTGDVEAVGEGSTKFKATSPTSPLFASCTFLRCSVAECRSAIGCI